MPVGRPTAPYTCSKIRGLGTRGLAFAPICIKRNSELGAESLVGPGVVGGLIPRMRLVSRKGDFQLHKQTPRRIVNMEAIQTRKEGVFSLEMVISRDPAASCCAPYREVQLALPPVHRSVLPAAPRLVSHINVSSERGVLIVGEDVREFHLEAVPFVINHNLLAGQRERLLLFEMSPLPYILRCF